MTSKAKAAAKRLGMLFGGAALAGLSIPLAARGPACARLEVQRLPWARQDAGTPSRDTLRVMTLNIAHGRANGFHQALLGRARIEANLSAIACELEREDPDVVALQEADGPSVWSGRFDHVRYLASAARYPNFVRGEHVQGLSLCYGTALVARVPLDDAESTTFAPSPPTMSKGFVVSTVAWPGRPDVVVDVVSVHLDFARGAVRDRQLQELAGTLNRRRRPAIVMGDFNCQYNDAGSPLKRLAEAAGLKVYQPAARAMTTFPGFGTRIDWILLSPDLEFAAYRTLPETLSDHLGVIAEVRLTAPRRP